MPDRTTTAALREFEAAVDGIGWLWRMCAADLVVALHGKMRARDLVVDRDPPWLPVDRGRRPARFLDDLVRTGHAEHSHQPALLTVAPTASAGAPESRSMSPCGSRSPQPASSTDRRRSRRRTR